MKFPGYLLYIFFLNLFFFSAINCYSQSNVETLFVKDIIISGNNKTKEYIILREFSFKKGDSIQLNKLPLTLINSKNNLLKTSLFNFVTINYTINNKEITFEVKLEERWYLWPYPILEQADRNLSSWINNKDVEKINYGACFIKYNFRGRKEILKIKTRLGYKEQYSIQYLNPYIGKKLRSGFSLETALFRQHEAIINTENNKPVYYRSDDDYILKTFYSNLSYTYRRLIYNTHLFSASFASSNISDTIQQINPYYFFQNETKNNNPVISYSFYHDKRDSKVYPLQGSSYGIKITNNWFLGQTKKTSMASASLICNAYQQLFNKLYWGIDLKGKYTFSGDYPFYYNKALGYQDFIRGYEYYIIDGKHFLTWKTNLKYEIISPGIKQIQFIPVPEFNKIHYAAYLNCFVDYGYVSDGRLSETNTMVNEPQYSFGIGLDFVTYYDKIFRIEYTVNKFGKFGLYFHIGAPIFTN